MQLDVELGDVDQARRVQAVSRYVSSGCWLILLCNGQTGGEYIPVAAVCDGVKMQLQRAGSERSKASSCTRPPDAW